MPSPLAGVRGLYVARFPERVKLGRAGNLRKRLRQHAAAGMVEAVAFATPLFIGPWLCLDPFIEREALGLAGESGKRIGYSESFTGLDFDAAVAIVVRVLDRRGVPAVHHDVDMLTLRTAYTSTGFVRYAS